MQEEQSTANYKLQKIRHENGTSTLTIIGADYLPFTPAHQYLIFLRYQETSPNTIKTYATALVQWLNYLEHIGTRWQEPNTMSMAGFAHWLRTGDYPHTARIGQQPPAQRSAHTIALKIAAVTAFYKWHAHNTGEDAAYLAVTSHHSNRGRFGPKYQGFLTGIADKKPSCTPVFKIRTGNKTRTPVLTPAEVKLILDTCATQDPETGIWAGTLAQIRNRFLFAVLAETGMRLGEALCLRHRDVNITSGTQPYIEVHPRQDHPHGSRVKARYERRIYIGDDLAALYSAYVWVLVDAGMDMFIDELTEHFIFVTGHDAPTPFAPLGQGTIYDIVRRLKRKDALSNVNPDWTPHWFRHTHATALLLSGAPPHIVMRRLGHQHIQTTLETYAWVTEDAELRAAGSWAAYAQGWENHTTDSNQVQERSW